MLEALVRVISLSHGDEGLLQSFPDSSFATPGVPYQHDAESDIESLIKLDNFSDKVISGLQELQLSYFLNGFFQLAIVVFFDFNGREQILDNGVE